MGRGWNHKVKIKHLFTDKEDWQSIQDSMNAIADVLTKDAWFRTFVDLHKFRQIPEGDTVIRPVDYANKLLDFLYNFADDQRIWIE
jgi:hypothetical protein